jgi:Helicase HerA, central domain
MPRDPFYIQLGMRLPYRVHPAELTEVPYGIRQRDLRSHLYIVGKTGTGKSTLIKSVVSQAISQDWGVGVLDPHGTLIEEILNEAIPPHRIKDTIVFAPGDRDWPVSLNLLRCAPHPSAVASGLVGAFEGLFGHSWGPRLEYILFCSIASLASASNTSLLGLERILVDRGYRERILRQVTDPIVLHFWHSQFDAWSEKYRTEAIESIQNKVGQLFASPELRNVLGQITSRINIRTIMDTPGSIFLANLSKGAFGDDKANLIGSFLVSLFRIAAMQREDTPEEERRDFLLIADEFQNFVTSSFVSALSEVRKYRLNLVLAHQFRKQMREDIRDAVFGNVGSILSFRVGSDDAKLLEAEFAQSMSTKQFLSLKRYPFFARMQENGLAGVPFEGLTVQPELGWYRQREAIIRASRARYAQPRAKVEAKIARFLPRKSPP